MTKPPQRDSQRNEAREESRRKQTIVTEYYKLKSKCWIVVLSGVVSIFIVPLIAPLVYFGVILSAGSYTLVLDRLLLYIIVVMIFYGIFRLMYIRHTHKIRKT